LRHHLTGQVEHILGLDRPQEKTHILTSVVVAILAGVDQNQDRQGGHSGVQFGYKRRPTNSGQAVPGDDQAESSSKLGLLHKAECLSGIGYPKDV
jgi:hypothetical protein